jgi:hypothetical protein
MHNYVRLADFMHFQEGKSRRTMECIVHPNHEPLGSAPPRENSSKRLASCWLIVLTDRLNRPARS